MAHRGAIEHHLFNRAMDLFDLQPTVTLYDLTNTFFEGGMHRQPRARRGHPKDKRTDCPLLTLGLVLDAPRGALVVMDRGIATEDRIQWLREQGYRYLVVSRQRTRHIGTITFGEIASISPFPEIVVSSTHERTCQS